MAHLDASPTPERDLILAADDNEQNLQLIEEYLRTWGYDVVLARDGREAVQLYPQHNPSLILLDVMMPHMDGYEACAEIKSSAQGRRIPVVMLTALTGTEDKIRALQNGADDFLNKPIIKEELRTRLRSLIRIRKLRKELDSSENIIVTLTAALESKHPHSGGHIHRVASYCAQICDRLGMNPDDRETIVKGALLHDLGLIGVPDAILSKENALTAEEQRLLAEHTTIGAAILEPMRTFQPFTSMVRWHHERLDGGGYPDGLAGERIPLEARIVAVANRFDEIRQETLGHPDESLRLLRSEAEGGGVDPKLVEVLQQALHEEPIKAGGRRDSLSRRTPHPRILCVDDSRLNRELISTTLAEVGLDVLHAGNGQEAMEQLGSSQDFDLVLLDLLMPVQSGHETLDQIRRNPRFEFLPVIVLTAQRNDEARKKSIVAGADDFLAYPLHRLELITRIRSLLRIKEYHSDLEQTQNVICALALALEAKDLYTRGHSQRVGDLAYIFARHLGLDPGAAERIHTAGLLHDIGKIAVPEALLNKQGPLTRDEFARVIDHPVIGEEMCRPLLSLTLVLQMIRHHHERYDGRGYPDGLAGEAIPFEVRLLSIADAYDALTSHRAYRFSALSHAAAVETLQREADAGKWDPALVTSFCTMIGNQAPDFAAISRPVPGFPFRE